jgi:4-aminobutyrate aminotransferase/(S)-3-amino-2-methylpropionate transaminase
MANAQEGPRRLVALSFDGGFHGRTLGSLSLTRSKPVHKVDFPSFPWPSIPFPDGTPDGEAASLDALNRRLRQGDVVAVVVEPIQGEGGDRHASAAFFRGVSAACRANGALFVADEVQTGCGATGRFWAHEHWDLPEPPDVVTFSKKFGFGGLFHRRSALPEPYRLFQTFCGDPFRGAILTVILDVIARDGLVRHTEDTGRRLLSGLESMATAWPDMLRAPRGRGTFCAVDARDPSTRDALLAALRDRGLEAGGSGAATIRFRPALVFGERHVGEALSILDDAVAHLAHSGSTPTLSRSA